MICFAALATDRELILRSDNIQYLTACAEDDNQEEEQSGSNTSDFIEREMSLRSTSTASTVTMTL